MCPAGNNGVVGLKPTLGLVAQDGIIPIAHSQDTAGPMARTVTDVALMLGAMQSPFGEVVGHSLPSDYSTFLRRGALRGARIGVDRRLFDTNPPFFSDPGFNEVAEAALDVMRDLGATVEDVDGPDPIAFGDAEFTVLLYEFKVDIARYLSGLRHTSMRTLADLIQFDIDHCEQEMRFFGQELFEIAESTTGLDDPLYTDARALCLQMTRDDGIDALMAAGYDAIVAPTYSFGSSAPAVAGYPNISVPTGVTSDGRPSGIWMYSGFLREPQLLAFAYDLEQAIGGRPQPQFLSSVPALPPDAGICAAPAAAAPKIHGRKAMQRAIHDARVRATHGARPAAH